MDFPSIGQRDPLHLSPMDQEVKVLVEAASTCQEAD